MWGGVGTSELGHSGSSYIQERWGGGFGIGGFDVCAVPAFPTVMCVNHFCRWDRCLR